MFKKNKTKLILLTCAILLLSFSLTGCGFTNADKTYEEMEKDIVGNAEPTGNKLCAVYKDGIYCNGVKQSGPAWVTAANINQNYGLEASESMGAYVRATARLLYGTVFGEDLGNDYFSKPNEWENFSLNPITVIQDATSMTAEELSDADGYLSDIASAISGIALAIFCALWLMSCISMVINERFTMEALLKSLMQLMCGALLVVNAETIVAAFMEVGNALVGGMNPEGSIAFDTLRGEMETLMTTPINVTNIGLSIFGNEIGVGSVWIDYRPIIVIAHLVWPTILQVVCAYKIISMLITRMLELTVRVTFAPIPIAFASQQGFGQGSIQYFRSTLACAMQPALMILGAMCFQAVSNIVSQIFSSGNASALSGPGAVVVMCVTYIVFSSYLGQTDRLAKEIIARG